MPWWRWRWGGGCATITRSTTEALEVNTNPPGAEVSTSHGHHCGSTPCSLRVPRDEEFVLTIKKDGCETARAQVSYGMESDGTWMTAGNIIFGGIIGLGVDAVSGANMSLSPNPVEVNLECD